MIGATKGDTRSLDYSSYDNDNHRVLILRAGVTKNELVALLLPQLPPQRRCADQHLYGR